MRKFYESLLKFTEKYRRSGGSLEQSLKNSGQQPADVLLFTGIEEDIYTAAEAAYEEMEEEIMAAAEDLESYPDSWREIVTFLFTSLKGQIEDVISQSRVEAYRLTEEGLV